MFHRRRKTKGGNDFVAGLDVGGTKTLIVDNISTNLHRYNTNDFEDLDALLEDYFAKAGQKPRKIVIAMAGPRNDETGEIKMTNCPWPVFKPQKMAAKHPGVDFVTTNDMVAATAGAVNAGSTDIKVLKPGKASPVGTKVVATISTGIGACLAVWDKKSGRHIFVPSEAGQMGFQPYTTAQKRHLEHIFTKYEHPSVELAIAGKFGMEHWIGHSPEVKATPELAAALERAIEADRPIGAVLLEFATEGQGEAKTAAHTVLDHMGALVGNMLADFALVYKATGGIYLMGSVSLGLGEYWAQNTGMTAAFVRRGTPEHSPWLEEFLSDIPIYLLTDPHIAASGSLALAKQD